MAAYPTLHRLLLDNCTGLTASGYRLPPLGARNL